MRVALEEIEEQSKSIAEVLRSTLSTATKAYLIYEASTHGLAQYLRLVLKMARSEASIELVDADIFPNVELPYVAEEAGPAVSLLRSSGKVHRVGTALKLLGVEHLIISTELPEQVRRVLKGVRVLEVKESIYSLSVMLGALKVATSIGSSARISRVRPELEIGKELVEEIKERFSKLAMVRERVLLCSTLMEVVCSEARMRSVRASRLSDADECVDAVLIHASVEDLAVREFVVGYMRKCPGKRIECVRINTDPLTAPIYALIALEELVGKQG